MPANAQRLLARMAWTGGAGKVVRLTLLAPDGTFVANSRPQGGGASANYANVDVRSPKAGTWTAVLYSSTDAAGYTGNITLATDTQTTHSVGSVSPGSFTLNAGQSKNVTVSLPTPASGGDATYSATFASSDGHQTSMAAVMRSLIPTSGNGKFGGTITGGNARAVSPAQTFSYEFDVPNGKKDLSVAVQLADFGTVVDGVLVDPNGELADVNSNLTFDADGNINPGLNAQLFDAHPLAGRWHLVVVVQNPVSGAEISQRYHRAGDLQPAADARDRAAELDRHGAQGRQAGDRPPSTSATPGCSRWPSVRTRG